MRNLQPIPTFVRYFVQTTLMIRFISFLLFTAISLSVFSQSDTIFEKVFYQEGINIRSKSLVGTPDDGAIFSGIIEFQNSTLTRVDSAGTVIWNKVLASTSTQTYPGLKLERIIQNSDSNYAAIGINFNAQSQKIDLCVMRFDLNGDTLWSRHFNGMISSHMTATSISESVDSCLLFCGYIDNSSNSFFGKIDLQGNVLWTKNLGLTSGPKLTSIIQTADSTIYLGGWSQDGATYPYSFIVALDHTGAFLWKKKISYFALNDLAFTDNALFFLGYHESAVSFGRMQSDGSVLDWAYSYSYSGSADLAERMKLTVLSNGDLLTINSGQFYSTHLTRITSDGNLILNEGIFIDGCMAIETRKKGILMNGSGPLFGVHALLSDHMGLIRRDSLNTEGDCTMMTFVTPQPLTLALSDLSISLSGSLSQVQNMILISDTVFNQYEGCVQYVGSVNEISSSPLVQVYPNPAKDMVEFVQEDGVPMKIRLLDLSGRNILETTSFGVKTSMDLRLLGEACYLYVATFEDGRSTRGKLIIKH
jgi:hypothetical protein